MALPLSSLAARTKAGNSFRVMQDISRRHKDGLVVDMDVKDIEKLLKNLGLITKNLDKKGASAAVRAGGSVMIKAIRQKAPVRTGTLRKHITQKVKTYSRTSTKVSIIGAKSIKVPIRVEDGLSKDGFVNKYANPANYFHLVEFGTKPHRITRKAGKGSQTIKHPGARANPFARTAWSRNSSPAKKAVVAKMVQVFDRYAKQVKAT